jgi:transaldolase
MELYLDSADINEIEEAFKLGFIDGLTTTPTFMHREGITDIDGTILKLSKMVPVLQIEALGETAEEVVSEAHRLLALGLKKDRTVFKIPASLEAMRACRMLVNEGIKVNIHLVYTLQQAYMAMAAGASYICILIGRMQDQGHNALELVEQCVKAVNHYKYDAKVMFSSVRHPQHVRDALELGVHTCTIPWKVMKQLTENNFTTVGTEQFFAHTRLITMRVKEVMRPKNPIISDEKLVVDAIVQMTESALGAVSIIDKNNRLIGLFTDGDLRRRIKTEGAPFLQKKMAEINYTKNPITIDGEALLKDAVIIFKDKRVDNIVVVDQSQPIGMLDIQDLVKLNVLI